MKNAQIMIVEDENIVAMGIKSKLESLGYSIPCTASSAEDAIRKADLFYPDLVLMDILLKGEDDGIVAGDYIRKNFDIPVIYLTAYTDEDTLERAKLTHPAGYISKPFKVEDIHTNIEIALHKNDLSADS
ncbi:CheY-like chemotaxis protein [Methanohalophilus euhalobius]|jgi:CheY-like chemotaxis protein|uniref:CheY chemotaxis protein or a CheY-like REC (Receiver) domain n=1 Tax=Methanohalophilus euhalobius TaxID=51203 RepID=A0A285FYH2_9EURY|nr:MULTISPECIES: response regulator [Methanohalophilus]RSD34125.1 MAG: response regulator receiver protein [Methanohalophilus sp.]OBZ34527.1 MAG: two-component system response regulator [Methanohalophilus sp. DAL1]ODV50356.1 MAG: response regulator receiver protein [Methanohalophilus sp. 2-GBenrich]TCL11759.1 CheY-like chemotaxis protein [Methanohalophilus euhalobius]SNY16315.1 CheY chemotaxis protein or a CheY-like REC (receiver) domain [Methanohalophilus euhalobius]